MVALTVVTPAFNPVMAPVELTVATDASELVHSGTTFCIIWPSESLAIRRRVTGLPTFRETESWFIETVFTGMRMLSDALAVFPSTATVIITLPIAFAVTRPKLEIVALAVSDELQVTERPVRIPPALSLRVWVSCWVVPITSVAVAGLIVTVATGTKIVRAAVPNFPSLVAVTVTLPPARAVTIPLLETVTFVESDELQVTVRPVSVPPALSFNVAVSC
jgi:hypothetical protein